MTAWVCVFFGLAYIAAACIMFFEWLIKKVSKQLSALNIKQLDYYTISHNQDPNLIPYLDCIQGAAELAKASINIHFISKNIDA